MLVSYEPEPRPVYRERMQSTYGIPADLAFDDWQPIVERPRFADFVLVATQDRQHKVHCEVEILDCLPAQWIHVHIGPLLPHVNWGPFIVAIARESFVSSG